MAHPYLGKWALLLLLSLLLRATCAWWLVQVQELLEALVQYVQREQVQSIDLIEGLIAPISGPIGAYRAPQLTNNWKGGRGGLFDRMGRMGPH